MSSLYNKTDNLLSHFPPHLREAVTALLNYGHIGLLPFMPNDISKLGKPVKFLDTNAEIIGESYNDYVNHFKFKIPYGGKHIHWELVFNNEYLLDPPDFYFNDETFPACDIDDIEEKVPGLAKWDLSDPMCLTLVLHNFLALYKEHQELLLERHLDETFGRIKMEYTLLMESFDREDFEMLLDNNSVHFLFKLMVDLSSLPEYIQEFKLKQLFLNPHEEFVLLRVSFFKLDGSKVHKTLQLSPRLDRFLNQFSKMYVPNFNAETSLAEYVELLNRAIKNKIDEIALFCQLKKQFCLTLVENLENQVLEFDSTTFSKVTFMNEIENYYTEVEVNLGKQFPKEKPQVILRSVFCSNNKTGNPCEEIAVYNFNPKSSVEIMVKNFLEALENSLQDFRNHLH